MIGFNLPENMEQMRTIIQDVAKNILRPVSRKYDEQEHTYPEELEIFRGMDVKKGNVEKKDDQKGSSFGAEGFNLTSAISVEEIAWGDVGLMLSIPGRGLGNAAINAVASKNQLEKFGKMWIAMAITEPESGSDSGSINATAELDGDEWILNGEKIFVTAADRCDAVVVWATVDKEAGKAGIKSFIVEKDIPGFTLEKLEHKLGIRASDTGTFLLKDCHIPKENLLGDPEVKKTTDGFKGVMKTFDNTRPTVASMAVGVSRASLDFLKEEMKKQDDIALDYHKNPNSISSREKEYYKMEAHLEASRLLTWRAAWMADNKEFNSLEASMSKAKAARAGTLITQKVCDLLGPVGYSCKSLAEKWMRDSKILDIFEGTGQIQHLIIARNILKLTSNELK